MNFSSLVAGRLADERKRLFSSQADAATACGVSREMWGKYERGVAGIGGEVLFLFAAAGADVNYILTGQRTQPPVSKRVQTLLNHYEATDEEGKRHIETAASLLSQRQRDDVAKKA